MYQNIKIKVGQTAEAWHPLWIWKQNHRGHPSSQLGGWTWPAKHTIAHCWGPAAFGSKSVISGNEGVLSASHLHGFACDFLNIIHKCHRGSQVTKVAPDDPASWLLWLVAYTLPRTLATERTWQSMLWEDTEASFCMRCLCDRVLWGRPGGWAPAEAFSDSELFNKHTKMHAQSKGKYSQIVHTLGSTIVLD